MNKPGGARHIDAAMDRMDPGRAGIRNDDAGGAEDRQAADDAEPSVERLGGECFAARYGDFDLGIGGAAVSGGDFSDSVAHHAPRHRIDRRLARRNRKSRPCYGADAFAGAKRHAVARPAEPHRRDDERAVRHVGIVAGVLDHACARRIPSPVCHRQRKAWPLAARQCHLDRIGKFAGDERGKRRLRRGGGAGAGGPSPAQWPFLALHMSSFNHASFNPARCNRHPWSSPA